MERCSHCGASLSAYWHKLTPGLVGALTKFHRAVILKGENKVHIVKDMKNDLALTKSEYGNWNKLRFHALVAKVKDDAGRHVTGYWLLTAKGNAFLRGEPVPRTVKTFRNKVVDHDPYSITIDRLGGTPYFEDAGSIEREQMSLPEAA